MRLIDFMEAFPDEASCKSKLKEYREKQGVVCPHCGSTQHYWKKDKECYECKHCHYRQSLKANTVMHGSQLPLRYWFIAMHLLTSTKKSFSAAELQRQLGHKNYNPIWALLHKLRNAMGRRDSEYEVCGMVELDEGFFSTEVPDDEKKYAESKSIIMDEKAIAKDALIFIVHPDNPVQSLTQEQIRAIYSGVITNWSEVGGFDMNITPYTRNRNSGSQEKMETIVMDGITMIEGTEMTIGQAMMSPYYQVGGDISGIGYTPFYYYDTIVQNEETKALAIDGIHPTKKTINNRSYPYTTDVYAAIRNNTDISSYTYKLFEYISTKGGQHIIEDSGYILLNSI